jgi:hypothetical protein
MNKPDFAELKEKLTEWTEQSMNEIFDLCSNDCSNNNSEMPCAVTGAQYQHAKSAAIISELIEIISLQNKEVESYARYIYCTENCKLSTSWSDHAKCTCGAEKLKNSVKAALSETTTRLQKLRDGK